MTEQNPITPPPELSPAAQALMEAYCIRMDRLDRAATEAEMVAAALRAAADQVVPQTEIAPQQDLESRRDAMEWGMNSQTQLTRHQLLAIAAELEGAR